MSETYNEVGPERYYVVSNSELLEWINAEIGMRIDPELKNRQAWRKQAKKAEATCRARPVPEWADSVWANDRETTQRLLEIRR